MFLFLNFLNSKQQFIDGKLFVFLICREIANQFFIRPSSAFQCFP